MGREESPATSAGREEAPPRRAGRTKSPSRWTGKKDASWGKKDASWRSFFEEPELWKDYREAKAAGMFQPLFPDFKRIDGKGDPLWLDNAPKWVKDKLRELESVGGVAAVNAMEERIPAIAARSRAMELLWRSLVDEPGLWTDYREGKQAGELPDKFPDFKKTGGEGEALWLDGRTPAWALEALADEASRGPAVVEEVAAIEEAAAVEVTVAETKRVARKGAKAEVKQSGGTLARQMWESLLNEPDQWIDNQAAKQAGNLTWEAPDFEHRQYGAKLWKSDPSIPQDIYDRLRNAPVDDSEVDADSSGTSGMELATPDYLASALDDLLRERRERREVA